MNTLKKAESKRLIYEIEVNDVFYLYAVGLQWIAISTKPDSQWGELPEWCKFTLGIETPNDPVIRYEPASKMTRAFIYRIIKDKIHEQRKDYESQAGNNKHLAMRPDQPEQETALSNTGRKGRKKVAASLFDESDNGAA